MHFRVGIKLIANNPCLMNKDNRPTLTVGKDYIIVLVDEFSDESENGDFAVVDDEDELHWFPIDEYDGFFKIK